MYNEICPPNSTLHVVKKGDTLWKLSQAYGVSVQSIIAANPGVNTNNLQIGSALCVPTAPTPPIPPHTCPDSTFTYIVLSGDTLWKLSQAFGVSVQSILDLNPGINPQNLQIGSTLCIPITPAPQKPPTTPAPQKPQAAPTPPTPTVTCPKGASPYTVQAGDTLWMLSQAYGVSIQSILDLNPGINPQNLQIGSTLCIPATPTPPAPQKPQKPQAAPTPPTPTVTCPKGASPYTVQAGDTLWMLSQAYGVSIQSILDLNPGINPQNLQIGSTLCIPAPPTPPAPQKPPTPPTPPIPPIPPTPIIPLAPPTPSSPSVFKYLIKKCDSICGIARKFYVSVESILQKNPGLNPRCLQAGTYIYVPINCCGENTCRYAIRKCDTLNSIANKFNVCPLDLIEANPYIDFRHLVRGQIICIPNMRMC